MTSMVHAEPVGLSASAPETPSFSVRRKFFPLRYYVFARWKDGREQKITRFREKANALDWIVDFSERWLSENPASR